MDREKFHKYIMTGMRLAFGISLAVTSLIAAIVLFVFFITTR